MERETTGQLHRAPSGLQRNPLAPVRRGHTDHRTVHERDPRSDHAWKAVQLRSFRTTDKGTQQKSLDVIGMTPTGNRDFDNLSGSEKFRQSPALRIAISRYNKERNNVTIDFFVVDEG